MVQLQEPEARADVAGSDAGAPDTSYGVVPCRTLDSHRCCTVSGVCHSASLLWTGGMHLRDNRDLKGVTRAHRHRTCIRS